MAAATNVSIRIVSNSLPGIPAEIHSLVAAEVETAARQVEAAAMAKCPVLTGTLRRSIHTVLSAGGMTATVGPSAAYGVYVELGARGRAGRPYMRPAAALVYPQFVAAVQAALRGLA